MASQSEWNGKKNRQRLRVIRTHDVRVTNAICSSFDWAKCGCRHCTTKTIEAASLGHYLIRTLLTYNLMYYKYRHEQKWQHRCDAKLFIINVFFDTIRISVADKKMWAIHLDICVISILLPISWLCWVGNGFLRIFAQKIKQFIFWVVASFMLISHLQYIAIVCLSQLNDNWN